ncbi:MAG: o-succinylbenzoate synthase [Ignavibacteriaceae bacterium]
MNNIELKYSPFKLELSENVVTARTTISERKGFIIKLKSSSKIGYGEAAPLPEFGSETFEQDEEALKNFKFDLKLVLTNFIESIDNNLKTFSTMPALRHGFEQALLNLFCARTNISLNEILNCTSKKEIGVNAVVGFLTPGESATAASKLAKEGFTTLKIKVGRDNFEEDIKCIKSIRQTIDKKIKLRLDANGKWNSNEAIDNINRLENLNIEYVEQPVKSLAGFQKVSFKTKVSLAADESIRSYEDAIKFIESNSVKALVLKPMLLGGIIPTLKIIDAAEKKKLKAIISSSFESALGRSMAIFAASTVKEEIAHGLDTARFLKKDLYPNPYPVVNGKISLPTTK